MRRMALCHCSGPDRGDPADPPLKEKACAARGLLDNLSTSAGDEVFCVRACHASTSVRVRVRVSGRAPLKMLLSRKFEKSILKKIKEIIEKPQTRIHFYPPLKFTSYKSRLSHMTDSSCSAGSSVPPQSFRFDPLTALCTMILHSAAVQQEMWLTPRLSSRMAQVGWHAVATFR